MDMLFPLRLLTINDVTWIVGMFASTTGLGKGKPIGKTLGS